MVSAKDSEIVIQALEMSEYEEILNLWRTCEGIGLSSADSFHGIRAYLDRNPGMSFVARKDSMIAGAVLCGHDGRRGYIHHLAVHPSCRRQGIGTMLVNACKSALEKEKICKCHLFIFKENKTGVEFWEMAGWSLRSDIGIMSADLLPEENEICGNGCKCSC